MSIRVVSDEDKKLIRSILQSDTTTQVAGKKRKKASTEVEDGRRWMARRKEGCGGEAQNSYQAEEQEKLQAYQGRYCL
jgi:hypothetical protein